LEKGMPISNSPQPEFIHNNGANPHSNRQLIEILSYFWKPDTWLIEFAALFCALFNRWMDFYLILILLFGYVGLKAWKKFNIGKKILLSIKKLAGPA